MADFCLSRRAKIDPKLPMATDRNWPETAKLNIAVENIRNQSKYVNPYLAEAEFILSVAFDYSICHL